MGVDPKSMRLTPMSKECYKKIFYVTVTCNIPLHNIPA